MNQKIKRVPIPERAKRYLESISKYGDSRKAKSYRKLGEAEQVKIASEVTGESITLARDGHYYLTCPGVQFHTNKNGRKDTRFMPGGRGTAPNGISAPSLQCVHQSCANIVEEFNRRIRSAIGKASVEYVTDHGSQLKNAAAALIIGFDMDSVEAHKILCAWGKTCTPVHSVIACGDAISAAQAAYKKHTDEVGYLLKPAKSRRPGTAPTNPQRDKKQSFASAHDIGCSPGGGQATTEPVYIGVRGRIAKQVRAQIEAYKDDYGIAPTTVLLGPDQPTLSGKLCGLPIEKMRTPGVSVHGETMDG